MWLALVGIDLVWVVVGFLAGRLIWCGGGVVCLVFCVDFSV